MVVDLNRLTTISDTLGHEVDNELLIRIGHQFRAALRNEDVLSRIDGNKFVVALLDIVTMAQQLHQEIVAEGVKTLEQMGFLRELVCDQLQGYLLSPAVAAAADGQMVGAG